jgi:hypothetical protein
MNRMRWFCSFVLAGVLAGAGTPARALDQSVPLIGADAATVPGGLDGTGVNIGQFESGHPNPEHAALPAAQLFQVNPTSLTNHATQVAGVLLSSGGDGADAGKLGIAPGARLFSFARNSATAPAGDQQVVEGLDALLGADGGAGVKVFNMSHGTAATTDGTSTQTLAVDWMAFARDVIVVKSAGNAGPGSDTVSLPGDCFNCITVGATGPDGVHNRPAGFSSEGPTADGRSKPDLVAPGVDIGTTTGIGAGVNTFADVNGTSFAAPHVAGVAALLVEHAGVHGYSDDHKVIKAVLLNSAMKDGGEKPGEIEVRDKAGELWLPAVPGTNPLDNQLGAGQLNVQAAFRQFRDDEALLGVGHDVVHISPIGWDIEQIDAGATVDYVITEKLAKGSKLTATLVWDRVVERTPCTAADCPAFSDDFTAGILSDLDMVLLDSLGTELFLFDALRRASYSQSTDDSVEHIYFTLPRTDYYSVRIHNSSDQTQTGTTFAFALWSQPVPEPLTLLLVVFGLLWVGISTRERRRRAEI